MPCRRYGILRRMDAEDGLRPEPGDVRFTESDVLEVFNGLEWVTLQSFSFEEPDMPIRHDDHRPLPSLVVEDGVAPEDLARRSN